MFAAELPLLLSRLFQSCILFWKTLFKGRVVREFIAEYPLLVKMFLFVSNRAKSQKIKGQGIGCQFCLVQGRKNRGGVICRPSLPFCLASNKISSADCVGCE